jgi:hypothetical protein
VRVVVPAVSGGLAPIGSGAPRAAAVSAACALWITRGIPPPLRGACPARGARPHVRGSHRSRSLQPLWLLQEVALHKIDAAGKQQ